MWFSFFSEIDKSLINNRIPWQYDKSVNDNDN
jgi:hypothetical protein